MSAPASDDVWLSATLAPCSERPGLQRHDRLPPVARKRGRASEGRNIAHALDMQADRGDAVVGGQRLEHLRHVDIGLIADGVDGSERQGAPRHGEVAGDVAGLGDDGDAAIEQTRFRARRATALRARCC